MTTDPPRPEPERRTLRERAEEVLRLSQTDVAAMPAADVQSLVHELQVYQVQLEIQNEDLRETQTALANSRDRYQDLYEFAPVAYLTLDRRGTIQTANLTAARLLQTERERLVGGNVNTFLTGDAQDACHRHRRAVFSTGERQIDELAMHTADDQPLAVRWESVPVEDAAGAVVECRTALVDVTAQREAEQRLRESERRTRARLDEIEAIYDTAPVGLCVLDSELRFVRINRRLAEINGFAVEEHLGRTVRDMVPDLAEQVEPVLRRIFRTGEPVLNREVHGSTAARPDEERIWIEQWLPLRDEAGHVAAVNVVVDDVTEERRLRDHLEHVVAERTSALKMLSDVAAMANRSESVEEAVAYVVERVCRHNGWHCGHAWVPSGEDDGELAPVHASYSESPPRFEAFLEATLDLRLRVGEGLAGRVYATGEPEFSNDVATVLEGERAYEAERLGIRVAAAFPVRVQERTVAVLEFFSENPIEPHPQTMESMASLGEQLGRVIERVRHRREARAREELLQAILTTAEDAIITINGEGLVQSFNPAAERMFGYAADEMLGRNVNRLMPSPYREEHDEHLARYVATGKGQILGMLRELVALRRSGELFPIEVVISEVDHSGLFTGIIRDVSQRKALQQSTLSIAEEEQREIGQELHDGVGQELVGLSMMVDVLVQELQERDADDLAERTEVLRSRIGETLESVRALSHGLVPFAVGAEGLGSALQQLSGRTDAHSSVLCRFEQRSDVPPIPQETATQLYRIAQEAVSNAIRHAEAERLRITLFAEASGTLVLEVLDDGVGLQDADPAGIGLKTMRYRAELIGAALAVSAAEPRGTVVRCRVPKRSLQGAAT